MAAETGGNSSLEVAVAAFHEREDFRRPAFGKHGEEDGSTKAVRAHCGFGDRDDGVGRELYRGAEKPPDHIAEFVRALLGFAHGSNGADLGRVF